jgi:ATP-binding cassette, subfamily B, bacterial
MNIGSSKVALGLAGLRWSRTARLLRGVGEVLDHSGRGLAIGVGVATLIEAGLGIAALYAVNLLVDAVNSALNTSGNQAAIPFYLALTGGLLIASVAARSVANLLQMRQGLAVGEYVNRRIHRQAISLDLSFYESAAYYDSLQKAREAGSERPAQVIGNVIGLTRGGIMLTGILAMLAAIEWRLLPLLLAAVGAALVVRIHFTRQLFAWRTSRAQMERRAGYLDWMITSNMHAKELRLNRLGEHLAEQFASLRDRIRKEQLAIERNRLLVEFGVAVVSTAVFVGAGSWLLHLALTGAVSVGQVVLFILLLRRAEGAGSEVVSSLSRIVDDYLFLDRLFSFLDVEPSMQSPARPAPIPSLLREGIRFENVGFIYPGATEPSLRNASFHLPPGRVVALVGENGSGKTTLIKLLTRLYEPTSGRITLEGQDIREMDPQAYRRLFSAIFQDYAVYPETVAENIRFGDVTIPPLRDRIEDAAHRGGATSFIDRLPSGFDTPLTKLFDNGHDLSIGQWQRVALSRSFYPKSRFIIMDEPTSAVDPAAEFELFENFRARLGERGALIISHRLSTVRQADYTYVLHKGRILEEGSHDELMTLDGAYAVLFGRQAQYYR